MILAQSPGKSGSSVGLLTVVVLLAGREDVKCRLQALKVYSVNLTRHLLAPFRHHFVRSSPRLASVFTKCTALRPCIAATESFSSTKTAQVSSLIWNLTKGIALTDLVRPSETRS